MLQVINDYLAGKPVAKRSPKWQSLRKSFLFGKRCAACGSTKKLVAHHKIPFHLKPELELDESNLIALCENKSHNCHLWIGHLGNYRSYDNDVALEAARFFTRLLLRPIVKYKP